MDFEALMILETMFTMIHKNHALKLLSQKVTTLELLGIWGLPLTILSLTGPARIGAAVRHKVHKLEVQELEDQ